MVVEINKYSKKVKEILSSLKGGRMTESSKSKLTELQEKVHQIGFRLQAEYVPLFSVLENLIQVLVSMTNYQLLNSFLQNTDWL